jgi:aspartate kinase
LIVMKFGGTSVADADRIRGVAEIVRARLGRRPVVVVSALGGVTDLLERAIQAARGGDLEALEPVLADLERRHRWALAGCVDEARGHHHLSLDVDGLFEDLRQKLRSIRILREGTPRAVDAILAIGETLSAKIVGAAFRGLGLPAVAVDPRDVMATDDRFGDAEPDLERTAELAESRIGSVLDAGDLPVLGGFVGATIDGTTTTLGRGGSDTSAAVLGSVLGAEEIQIWTDVDGLMTADPRLVPGARTIARVSFAEAAELAFYGAEVLHPDSLAPAVQRGIPVRVANSMHPDHPGTVIVDGAERASETAVVSVASRAGVTSLRVVNRRMRADPEFASGVLATLRSRQLAPDLLVASEIGVHLAIDDSVASVALQDELARCGVVEVQRDRAIVCMVGSRLADGRSRREALEAISACEPELLALGSSGASLTALVSADRLTETVRGLHHRFFEDSEAK